MNKLHEFVTQTAARSQITFGDVRRLQRDCLPGGINTGEEVERLIWLDSTVRRADKAWSQWLVAAIADFALRSDVTEDGVVDWLKRLTAAAAQGTTVRPRILRQISHAKRCPPAKASLPTEQRSTSAEAAASLAPTADTSPREKPTERPPQRRKSSRPTSRIKTESTKISGSRQSRDAKPSTIPAPLVWSSGMAWKQACFPLAAPCD
jgi:hypothetical protein